MSKLMWLVVIIAGLAVGIYLMQNYTALGLEQFFQPFKDGLTQVFDRIQTYVNRPSQIFSDVSTFSHSITVGLTSVVLGSIFKAAYNKGIKKTEEVSQKALNIAEQKTEAALTQAAAVTTEKDTLTTQVDLLEQTVQKQEKYFEGIINEQKGKMAQMGEQITKLIDEKTQLQRLLAQEKVIIEKSVP